MKENLYHATFSVNICFVTEDSNINNAEGEAFNAISGLKSMDDVDINMDSIDRIESIDEIPYDWCNREPIGATKICEDFFENLDEARRISDRLEKLGYDLEDSFVEDIQHILNTPLGDNDTGE